MNSKYKSSGRGGFWMMGAGEAAAINVAAARSQNVVMILLCMKSGLSLVSGPGQTFS
jgi:hypothetical protein